MLRLQKRKTHFSDIAHGVTIQTFRATLRAATRENSLSSIYIYGLSDFLKSESLGIAQVLSKHLPFAKDREHGFPGINLEGEFIWVRAKTLDAHFQISTFDSVFQLILAEMGSGQ